MFIFGRKKEEDPYAKYKDLAKKYGLTMDQIRKIGRLIVRGTQNIPKILVHVDPEQNERRIHKILEVKKIIEEEGAEPYIYKKHPETRIS